MKLQKLAADFLSAAESYGRIIISEFDPTVVKLPPEEFLEKISYLTIKPTSKLGGVAGGLKFVHNGILFKFALDCVRLFV